jgi:hypothetical protein
VRLARPVVLALAALLLLAIPAEARLPKRTVEAREAFSLGRPTWTSAARSGATA